MRAKTFPLNLARDYVHSWTPADAIRDLFQNAIDGPTDFNYSWTDQEDGFETLQIFSPEVFLARDVLIMGVSTKRDDSFSIGQFGEGLKLAMLVLTREGMDMTVYNNPVVWTPLFKNIKGFATEILCVEESTFKAKNVEPRTRLPGLHIEVRNIGPEQHMEVQKVCLFMHDKEYCNNEEPSRTHTRIGSVLEHPVHRGQIYVEGLFVADFSDKDLKYGYDFKANQIKLDRDRKTLDTWDLFIGIMKIWDATEEHDRIAKMMDQKVVDVSYMTYSSTEMVKDACYNRFVEQHGEEAIMVNDQDEFKALIDKGITKVVFGGGSAFSNSVQRAKKHKTVEVVIPEEPTPEERLQNLYEAFDGMFTDEYDIRFKAILEESKKWVVES